MYRRGIRLIALLPLVWAGAARAQEMEPRAYSPSPIGINFFAATLGGARGEILFDPTVPVTDVNADLGTATFGYGRSVRFGRLQGLVLGGIPYVVGHLTGNVSQEARDIRRSGFGDLRVKVSVNLVGARAMTREEFAKAPPRTVFGVSLAIQAPVGEYDPTKLINIGTNRWAFKPEIGVSVPVKRWFLDAYAGASFFTNNENFYPGSATRRQDPLYQLQGHAAYVFKSRAWLALDATWYWGGVSTVDNGPPSTRQSNTRAGLTFSAPITPRQSIKTAASTGTTARTGTKFDSIFLTWQFAWFDEPARAQAP
jgi:hypothetical protein